MQLAEERATKANTFSRWASTVGVIRESSQVQISYKPELRRRGTVWGWTCQEWGSAPPIIEAIETLAGHIEGNHSRTGDDQMSCF